MKNNYTAVFFILLAVSVTVDVYSKNGFDEKNNHEQAGHADDISKLLTGNTYWANNGNSNLFTTLKGLTYIMYLTVDSTMSMDTEKEYSEVNDAVEFLRVNMKQLNFDSISNFREFLTPGWIQLMVYIPIWGGIINILIMI